MSAESAIAFEALERQASELIGFFRQSGYERVAPALIQPAQIYLEHVGEAIRGRTYLFTDPDGEELCLRPDLTLPAARVYLERHPEADLTARYCYNGPAFRARAGEDEAVRPREFRQAGLELFGAADAIAADAEVIALADQALRRAGLTGQRLQIGDLGLVLALLEAIDMPERWRKRLRHALHNHACLHSELERLAGEPDKLAEVPHADLLKAIDPAAPGRAERMLAAYLDERGMPVVGARTLTEIAERVLDQAADLRQEPLPADSRQLLECFGAMPLALETAADEIHAALSRAGVDIDPVLGQFEARVGALRERDVDVSGARYDGTLASNMAYYTGLVFDIELPGEGLAGQIARGGRYDRLLWDLGAPSEVPAVGCAIHTERLLAATGRGQA